MDKDGELQIDQDKVIEQHALYDVLKDADLTEYFEKFKQVCFEFYILINIISFSLMMIYEK